MSKVERQRFERLWCEACRLQVDQYAERVGQMTRLYLSQWVTLWTAFMEIDSPVAEDEPELVGFWVDRRDCCDQGRRGFMCGCELREAAEEAERER